MLCIFGCFAAIYLRKSFCFLVHHPDVVFISRYADVYIITIDTNSFISYFKKKGWIQDVHGGNAMSQRFLYFHANGNSINFHWLHEVSIHSVF